MTMLWLIFIVIAACAVIVGCAAADNKTQIPPDEDWPDGK